MKIWKKVLTRKAIGMILIVCLLLKYAPINRMIFKAVPLQAATFDDVNQGSVFLKQEKGSVTCTLVSTTMLLRRAAMMSGNSAWGSITENSLKSTAWVNGVGLRHNFSYAGLTVSHGLDLGGDKGKLISMLNYHPEGIVIYNTSMPHAILVTDYSDGTFYCADPSPYYPAGRIPISAASFDINSATAYWYVSSPKLELTTTIPVTPVTTARLEFDKTIFLCAGAITFYGKADGGNVGQVDIYKEGSYLKSLNLPPNSYVTDYFDDPGSYHAVYWVSDGTNSVTAEVMNFTVHNTYVCPPQNMDVGLEKNIFNPDEHITVYMFSDYVTGYDLKIYKNGVEVVSDSVKAFHNCKPGYTYKTYYFSEPGNYVVKAQAKNMHGVSEQKECTFSVKGMEEIPNTPTPSPGIVPTEKPDEKPENAIGDVNGDSKINLIDAQCVLKWALRIEKYTDMQKAIADVNGDNEVDLKDAQLVLKKTLKIIKDFPVTESK